MCSKSFKSVEQRTRVSPCSLESFYIKTKHSDDISVCEIWEFRFTAGVLHKQIETIT